MSTSTDFPPAGDSLENFCKKVLKSRIFLGEFREKRLVSSLQSYRDVIVVDVHSESAIVNDLDVIQAKVCEWSTRTAKDSWIGVTRNLNETTRSLESISLWTELESFYPFGKYWFQIKTVRFRDNEILLKLKVLRSVDDSTPLQRTEQQELKWEDIDWSLVERGGQKLYIWTKNQVRDFIIFLLSMKIHPGHIFAGVKMIIFVAITAIVSAFQGIQLVGNFGLRFMQELRKCIHVLTPIFLGTLDIFSKIVGGFYMLIAMIWRDSINLRAMNNNRNNYLALPQAPRRRNHWASRN
ncbi:uncharacterized protein DMENIID0001_064210 [Sergentomyia squamirostris]